MMAIVLLDSGARQETVRVQDLRKAATTASSVLELDGYQLFDLVELYGSLAEGGSSAQMQPVGIIVGVGPRELQVLQTNNQVKSLTPAQLRGKLTHRMERAQSVDKDNKPIRRGDIVRVMEGIGKGLDATVRHIFHQSLFLHSKQRMDHGGVFVTSARRVHVLGQSSSRAPSYVPQSRLGVPQAGAA